MKAKAIRDLSQLNDKDLVKQLSEGLDLIIDHTLSIEEDAQYLAEQNKKCGFNILEAVLKEEAAKFLILFDAIRCPRVPPNNFSKQLNRFNDHLAKGIYALVYDFRPAHFGDIRGSVERECHEYYLDGPNAVDWIFRNEILQRREEYIYVDYIESNGDHIWLTPKRFYHPEMSSYTDYLRPKVMEVATALWKAGCTKSDALMLIAKNWRSIQMTDDFSWQQLKELNRKTLKDLDNNNLLPSQPESVYSTIIEEWLFPLHSLDIRIIQVDKQKLKEIREQRFFNIYY